jgi:tight adherence protein C
MSRDSKEISERDEVAQLGTLLSVAFDAGLGIVAALEEVIPKARGSVSTKFQRLLDALAMGGNLHEELGSIRNLAKNPALDELVLKLLASLQFGTPISVQLASLARSNRTRVAQAELAEAAKRENLMLLPLVFLILPVTVLFAIYPSLEYLNLNQ